VSSLEYLTLTSRSTATIQKIKSWQL